MMSSRSWLRFTSPWPRSLQASNFVARKYGAERCLSRKPSETKVSCAASPATVVALAWHDPLHDEGVAYAQLLRDAGADVQVHTANDMSHGFLRHCLVVPAAREHVRQVAGSLARYLEAGVA